MSQTDTTPVALAEAAALAFAELRQRLIALIGRDGYAALLNRSLRLAQVGNPALGMVRLNDQSATGLHDLDDFARAHAGSREAAKALASVLAHIISLLALFIGEEIAVGLVYDAWPEIALDTAERGSEHA